MASPVALHRRHSGSFSEHTRSFSEHSRLLAGGNAVELGGHGGSSHGKMNYKEAVFNAINVLLGVGVLSSPFALRSSGMLVGVPLFFFFTLVTNHTGKLLGYCLDYQEGMQVRVLALEDHGSQGIYLPKRVLGPQTYPDIGEAAFGTRGRLAISVIFFSELFTACAMFDVLSTCAARCILLEVTAAHAH